MNIADVRERLDMADCAPSTVALQAVAQRDGTAYDRPVASEAANIHCRPAAAAHDRQLPKQLKIFDLNRYSPQADVRTVIGRASHVDKPALAAFKDPG